MAKPTRTPAWAGNMQKLGPGIYMHGTELHVSEAEICEHLGVRYTRASSKLVEKFITEIMAELAPDAKVATLDHGGQTNG